MTKINLAELLKEAGCKPRATNPLDPHKTEILDAIAEGYPRKAIWKLMFDEKIIETSYDMFLRYLKAWGKS